MHRATEGLEERKPVRRRGRLAAGGVFVLVFGLTLGVFLTQSLRPRLSEMDPITGDFLTGTGRGGGGSAGMAGKEHALHLLAQGRTAFERQEWAKAIDSFKALLDIDSSHPEAHTYMGLILARANHADGALLAFDRALSANPNFPLALWGKGMVLYHDKEELSLARETLEKLASMLPAGEEREEIEKTIAEISAATKRKME
jgi:tetratricopeptide (TPR) repeat protein